MNLYNMKELPKKFTLNGIDFKVTKVDEIDNLGEFDSVAQEIRINTVEEGMIISPQIQENTYYHEVAHALLWNAGGDWENELLVQSLGNVLQQYIKSVE